jgi:hypothetical protein
LAEEHETVEVPDPVMLLVLKAPHVSPEGTVLARDSVPVKPFSAPMVIVELADWPVLTALGELADIVKSGVGGPRDGKVSRHPHPIGLLSHVIAPYTPEPGVLVQLPAGHQTQLILCGVLLS